MTSSIKPVEEIQINVTEEETMECPRLMVNYSFKSA